MSMDLNFVIVGDFNVHVDDASNVYGRGCALSLTLTVYVNTSIRQHTTTAIRLTSSSHLIGYNISVELRRAKHASAL